MSSDEESEEVQSWKGVPATIICINTYGPGMHDVAQVAHAATSLMIREYLRGSSSKLIGVCLYGTEGSNTSVFGIKSVEEVLPLSSPNLKDYKNLKKINISSVKQASELILSNVLWYCNKAFASCKRQLSSRSIIVLSRFDIPPAQTDERPALKRVVDLIDSNIEIRLINIAETKYEVSKFYNTFLIEANKGDEVAFPNPVWDHKEVKNLMDQVTHRHLAVARLSFEIGEGLAIGVGVYNLLRGSWDSHMKKSYLHRDTNAILTTVNKTVKIKVGTEEDMDVDEAEEQSKPMPLLKSELLHYQIYGDERVEFSDDEMKLLRNPFGPPMLKLLGFKPASLMCKEKWFISPGYFLFPNEAIIEGSIVAFKALHQACVELKKVAICVLCTRINARPCIVALSPTTKPLGLNVDIGFDVIRVPFVEHVRNIPNSEDDTELQITEEKKTVLKDILKALSFDYQPDMFEDPKLQSQYIAIEAKVLEENDEDVDPFIDTTKPDSKKFQCIQDDIFHELFGSFESVAVKKSAKSRDGGPESKKAKVVDEDLLKQRLDNEKVEDYTVVQLKDILKYKNIPELPALTGLLKNDLVALVYKHCK